VFSFFANSLREASGRNYHTYIDSRMFAFIMETLDLIDPDRAGATPVQNRYRGGVAVRIIEGDYHIMIAGFICALIQKFLRGFDAHVLLGQSAFKLRD
jgi:hypothetical protein